MKTIKLELSVKILLGAIALGLFLNAFKDFPPKAFAARDLGTMFNPLYVQIMN